MNAGILPNHELENIELEDKIKELESEIYDLKLRIEDLTAAADFGKQTISDMEDTIKQAFRTIKGMY